MKIFISADLEGVGGVVSRVQLGGEGDNYRRARQLMTDEVNAAARGAFEAGAEEVVVADGHGPKINILPENLHEEVSLISGTPRAQGMMAGISGDFALVFLTGYHSLQGERGTLSHTYSGSTVGQLKLNDRVVGELGLNAFLAGYYEVPVGLVTGDDAVCVEGKHHLGDTLKTAPVKENLAHGAAKSLSPRKACQLITERAREAVKEKAAMEPVSLQKPVKLEITFKNRGMAEAAASMPGSELVNGSTVKFSHPELPEVVQGLQVMVTLASSF